MKTIQGRDNMKRFLTLSLFLVFILTACGPSSEELAFQTQEAETAIASNWTETPTLTRSLTPTPTFTPTPTSTPTLTPTITPTPSPTPFAGGGLIAFHNQIPGVIEYYLMNPDGTGVKKIFGSNEIEVAGNWNSLSSGSPPKWSPTGRYLLFYFNKRSSSFNLVVYVYDTVSDSSQLIFQAIRSGEDANCEWAPDENYIICNRYFFGENPRNFTEGGLYKISMMEPDQPEYILPSTEELKIYHLISVLEDGLFMVAAWQNGKAAEGPLIINKDGEIEKVISISPQDKIASIDRTGYLAFGNKATNDFHLFRTYKPGENPDGFVLFDLRNKTLTDIIKLDDGIAKYSLSPDGNKIASAGRNLKVIDVESKLSM
jgi:hypothetical protein